ncbi:MAG: hypothetical protein ACI9RO_001051 [Alteromonas macleodii]|jgi:hypothetical protein
MCILQPDYHGPAVILILCCYISVDQVESAVSLYPPAVVGWRTRLVLLPKGYNLRTRCEPFSSQE